MTRAVIVVRTANRCGILNRCIEAAVKGCSVAREAFWVVLDDSSPDCRASNLEVTRSWKRFGLRLAYIDKMVEDEIADSLPGLRFRHAFAQLAARPAFCPSEGGRNLALVTGLSLNPEVLFFVDDDMVHRHEDGCFFHWCLSDQSTDNFIASPRKLGVSDMPYLRRLATVLRQENWPRFISDAGFTADSDTWYSPANSLWKAKDETINGATRIKEREVVSGQLMALRDHGMELLPFPREYNADLNWSFLQSCFRGTPLLKVSVANAQHLPAGIGHAKADVIRSEIVGTAITRSLRQIKPRGDQVMTTLAERLPAALGVGLRQDMFLFLEVEQALRVRIKSTAADKPQRATLLNIERTLDDVAEQLKSLDSRELAGEWLDDTVNRREMLMALRRNDAVQSQIRRSLFDASA